MLIYRNLGLLLDCMFNSNFLIQGFIDIFIKMWNDLNWPIKYTLPDDVCNASYMYIARAM